MPHAIFSLPDLIIYGSIVVICLIAMVLGPN